MFYLEHVRFTSGGIEFRDKMGRKLDVSDAFKKIINRFKAYFEDVDLFILRLAGFFPIHTVRYFFYTLEGVNIGKNVHIHMGTQFFQPKNVSIGEGSIIGQNAFLDGRAKLEIGKYVDIASDVMIYNSQHDINSENFEAEYGDVKIGDYCFIGPRVVILPGVNIGKGAVVAAGAVVTKDVGDFKIVGGIPADEIGERKTKDLHYKLGRSRLLQ